MRSAKNIALMIPLVLLTILPIWCQGASDDAPDSPPPAQGEFLKDESSKITSEALKKLIKSILSQRAFQEKETGTNLGQWVNRQLEKLWERIRKLNLGTGSLPVWVLVLAFALLILMITYLLLLVARAYSAELKAKPPLKSAEDTPEALLRAADDQAKKGNLGEALRLYYRSVLLTLFPSLALTTTSSALLRILGTRNPLLSVSFSDLTDSFNLVYYGGEQLTEKVLTNFKEQTLGILRASHRSFSS